MTEKEQMLAVMRRDLELHRLDWHLRAIMADLLEEMGHATEALAHRYMLEKCHLPDWRIWPCEEKIWIWGNDRNPSYVETAARRRRVSVERGDWASAILPFDLWFCLRGGLIRDHVTLGVNKWWKSYPSEQEASLALGHGLSLYYQEV